MVSRFIYVPKRLNYVDYVNCCQKKNLKNIFTVSETLNDTLTLMQFEI